MTRPPWNPPTGGDAPGESEDEPRFRRGARTGPDDAPPPADDLWGGTAGPWSGGADQPWAQSSSTDPWAGAKGGWNDTSADLDNGPAYPVPGATPPASTPDPGPGTGGPGAGPGAGGPGGPAGEPDPQPWATPGGPAGGTPTHAGAGYGPPSYADPGAPSAGPAVGEPSHGAGPGAEEPFRAVRPDAVPPSGGDRFPPAGTAPGPTGPGGGPAFAPAARPAADVYTPAEPPPTPRPPQPELPDSMSDVPQYAARLAPAPLPDGTTPPAADPGPSWTGASDTRPPDDGRGTPSWTPAGSGTGSATGSTAPAGGPPPEQPAGGQVPPGQPQPGQQQPGQHSTGSHPTSPQQQAGPDPSGAQPGQPPQQAGPGGYGQPGPYGQHPGQPPQGAPAGWGGGPAHAAGGTPPPAAIPRPEDLLVSSRPRTLDKPAEWGWRGRLGKMSGGLFKLKPSPAELADRQAKLNAQRGFSRPMTVVVIQPKGGAGKTPTTICVSSALGVRRGGYIVGWDNNETRGTLAVRTTNDDNQRTTAWDLLGRLDEFERSEARVGDLGYYMRAQGDAQFDALVSDDNPGNMAQIGEVEFRRIHQVLQRFYRMIIIDTGNNVRSTNWQAAVDHADQIVVVSTYQRDVGYSGSWVLDHLAQTGRDELARDAITVLTAAEPTVDDTVKAELVKHFSARTRAVVEVPYDPHIAEGGPIRWAELSEGSKRAWTSVAAAITQTLYDRDQRQLARNGRPG